MTDDDGTKTCSCSSLKNSMKVCLILLEESTDPGDFLSFTVSEGLLQVGDSEEATLQVDNVLVLVVNCPRFFL